MHSCTIIDKPPRDASITAQAEYHRLCIQHLELELISKRWPTYSTISRQSWQMAIDTHRLALARFTKAAPRPVAGNGLTSLIKPTGAAVHQ